jgi:hypothetical protein
MALLTLIVLVGSSAFGLFGQKWGEQLGNFDLKMRRAQDMMLVQDILDSLIPYVVLDRKGKPVVYFEGNQNGFVTVSSQSLINHGSLSVVRFSVKQNSDLSFDVLFEESPMRDVPLVVIDQDLQFSEPIWLFKSVQNPRFEYFGKLKPSKKSEFSEFEITAPQAWVADYNSAQTQSAPTKARLTFDTLDGEIRIYSVLASAKPGMLSGYKGGSSDRSDDGAESSIDENCYC